MIKIEFDKATDSFQPGEQIAGTVTWSEEDGNSLEIRLFWYTVGKGDRDFELIENREVEPFASSGSKRFQFTAPTRPHSFSGKLISLQWSIEAIVFPQETTSRRDLIISNSEREINLLAQSPESA